MIKLGKEKIIFILVAHVVVDIGELKHCVIVLVNNKLKFLTDWDQFDRCLDTKCQSV